MFARVVFFVRMALAVAAGICVAPQMASAALISNASFGIGGAFTTAPGTHLGNTDSIFISNGGAIIVTAGDTMDLVGIVNFGDTGTLQDLPSLSGFTPISNYLTLSGGAGVSLNTLTVVGRTGPVPGFINLAGSGVITAPGFDPTPANLTWTGNTSDNQTFTFAVTTSAHTQTSQVPEPFSLSLLGLGLVGLFAARQKQRRA